MPDDREGKIKEVMTWYIRGKCNRSIKCLASLSPLQLVRRIGTPGHPYIGTPFHPNGNAGPTVVVIDHKVAALSELSRVHWS